MGFSGFGVHLNMTFHALFFTNKTVGLILCFAWLLQNLNTEQQGTSESREINQKHYVVKIQPAQHLVIQKRFKKYFFEPISYHTEKSILDLIV